MKDVPLWHTDLLRFGFILVFKEEIRITSLDGFFIHQQLSQAQVRRVVKCVAPNSAGGNFGRLVWLSYNPLIHDTIPGDISRSCIETVCVDGFTLIGPLLRPITARCKV